MQKKFWSHKKVLITGANGFVGRQLVRYLTSLGADVTQIVRNIGDNPKAIACDIANRSSLESIFSQNSFFACFHLAADALVEQGESLPYETLKNNIFGALNILELGRIYKTKRLIIASTVHVYGDSQNPYEEGDPPRPSRPYETSKTCVDVIAQSYADTFDLPVLIPRFANIYGPGDLHFSRIIPKTIKNILHNVPPTMWGGNAVREYLYIDDVLRAYEMLAVIKDSQIEKNRIFNFGTGITISASSLIRTIMKLSCSDLKIKKIPAARENEISVQRVNWNKAKRILGWRPIFDLPHGLERTIDWYKDYFRINRVQI